MKPQLIKIGSKLSPELTNKLSEYKSITQSIEEEFLTKMRGNFSNALEEYLRQNLKKHGFEFETRKRFFEFCKDRIQRVEFRKEEEVHYYLDWKSEDERGIMVGLTHENRVRVEYKDGKFIGTIG